MLHRLEAPDGAPELLSRPGVRDGHVEAPLRTAKLFRGEQDGSLLQRTAQHRSGLVLLADQAPRGVLQLDGGQGACRVESRQPATLDLVVVSADDEQRQGRRVIGPCCGHHDQIRGRAVDDQRLGAAHPGAFTVGTPRGRCCGAVPVPIRLSVRKGCRLLTTSQLGEDVIQLVPRHGQQEGAGGEADAREERAVVETGAQLLQHHRELDGPIPHTAVLLGDGERGESELLGHLLPDRRVVAAVVEELPEVRQRRALGDEAPHELSKLLLLGGKIDHSVSLMALRATPASRTT